MYKQKNDRMNALLGQPLDSFTTEDEVFFAAGVAYRFRNNMFHGNKGVHTWLRYSNILYTYN